MPDKFDEMAAVAGAAAGLRPEQYPGFAHILRQVAAEEREACAKIAEEGAYYGTAEGAEDMATTIARLIRDRGSNAE